MIISEIDKKIKKLLSNISYSEKFEFNMLMSAVMQLLLKIIIIINALFYSGFKMQLDKLLVR